MTWFQLNEFMARVAVENNLRPEQVAHLRIAIDVGPFTDPKALKYTLVRGSEEPNGLLRIY